MRPNLREIVDQLRQHPRLVIADDFEIAIQGTECHTNQYRNGEPVKKTRDAEFWVSLRLIHRHQPGRATTTFRSREDLTSLVDAAFDSAARSSVDLWFRFPIWKAVKPVAEAEPESSDAYESLYSWLAVFPETLDESYDCWTVDTHLSRKTERFQLSHRRQSHSVRLGVGNRAGERYYSVQEARAQAGRLGQREVWLEDLLRKSHGLQKARFFSGSGKVDVLASPVVVAALLNRMAPWFYADNVQNGRSPFSASGSSGPFFASGMTLSDSGIYPGAPNTAPFDLEGSLTQETRLVENGHLVSFLYDAYAAARDNRISTGNFSRRPGMGTARIGTSTLFLAPSSVAKKDLLSGMATGILLETVDTLESIPHSETEVELTGSGWKVEGGRKTEPLFGIHLQIDILSAFRNALAVGSDAELYEGCGASSILFEKIPIGE